MARVSVAAVARSDIKKILRYLADQGGVALAVAFSQSLADLRLRLGVHPKAYMMRPSLGAAVRLAVISPYLILYRHFDERDHVIILRVIHGRRNITSDFLKMS